MKRLTFLLVFYVLTIIACEDNKTEQPDQNLNITLNKAAEKVVEASNDFTFNIFNELEKECADENIFFSPLSISMALSMAMNGAVGETKQQIKDVIDFGNYSDEEINAAFKSLQDAFTRLDEEVEISLANSAWYDENNALLDTYRNILVDYYYAEIAGVSFLDVSTVDMINEWIAEKTNDKIKNMISNLDPATALVLVNAIYFNGNWKYEFDQDLTYDGIFTGLNSERIECEMMQSGKIKSKYIIDEEKVLASLPYGDGCFEMVIYMPNNGTDLQTLIEDLDAGIFSNMLVSASSDSIIVHMPKFKIETKTISLVKMLRNLGMLLPFSGSADFSNIFGDPSIFISDVLHKAFIKVNEEGTEAAAATVVVFEYTSVGGGSDDKVIVLNKPFIFFIREVSTGQVLFAGKLIKP